MNAQRPPSSISSLKPNVTRAEAIEHFTRGTFRVARWFHGPVRSVAELYIPFRLFKVTISNQGRVESQIFGLDAVQGEMDLYHFPSQPAPEELVTVASRNVLPAALDRERAKERVLAMVRRLVFARGFFKLRDVRFEADEIPGEIHVPYWICFRGPENEIRISILDAVRRRNEGAKARRVVEDWLRSQ